MNRWKNGVIEYNEVDKLREALVGRAITAVHTNKLGTYHGEVNLVLDNGDILTAYEADGGCACNNGCFNLTPHVQNSGMILGVDQVEESGEYSEEGVIRLFIYTELGKQEILTSEGQDNGYYGWGYYLNLKSTTKENN